MFLFIFVLQQTIKPVEKPIKIQQGGQQGRLFLSLIGDGFKLKETRPSGHVTLEKGFTKIVLIPKTNRP